MKPDIEIPENFSESPTPAMVHDTTACTPENKPENKPDDVLSNGSLSTPPVSKCFAPKKRRIDLNYEKQIKLSLLLIFFVVCDILL